VVKSRTSQQYQANYAYNAGMIIYPNPADQTTTVAWTGSYSKLSIHSISGKQVYQATISGNQATLQASSLPPGVYTLQLLGTNGKQTGKLIVERNP
jgi:septal ring-binding cell division protein DamX